MVDPTGVQSISPEASVAGDGGASGSGWEAFYRNYRAPGYVPGFEILNRLGAGVFGVVFKARKISIGKFYAIKFLKVDDDAVKDAVRREIESVRVFAQIDHPNLVSIEDRGEVDGIPYIVMEYAGEETLRRRLEGGPLAAEDARAIFVQVARGVEALHDRGLAHFDLKPANVFLKGGTARVGDYGLSKLVSESRQTLSFGRGTPYYMAPEMLRRHGDHRSDLYSLGCLLFEMATGAVPFRGETEWEVLKRHESDEVAFPAGFPAAFRPTVARCMAKDPAARFPTVAALLAELGEAAPDGAARERGEAADPLRRDGGERPYGFRDRIETLARDVRDLRRRHRRGVVPEPAPPPVPPSPSPFAAAGSATGDAPARTAGREIVFQMKAGLGDAGRSFGRGLGAAIRMPFRALGAAIKVAAFAFGAVVMVWVLVLVVSVLSRVVGNLFGVL